MEGRALSLMLAPSAKLAASAKPKPPREPKQPAANADQAAAASSESPTLVVPNAATDADDDTDVEEE
jgi:hypothetical protein